MSDPISATLNHALDRVSEDPSDLAIDGLDLALATAAARREELAREGVRVDESPYLHFLRRFAAEPVPTALAASA